ncbi:MAG: substrate-binding domain-containing protein [Clostridia bacterium]|nr:substrate-binding domain-containing protein [Clostridia bacterium]
MKHNKIWLALTLISGSLLIIAVITGLAISNEIKNKSLSVDTTAYNDEMYHIMFLLNEDDQSYGTVFMNGVDEACEAFNIAKEIIMIPEDNYLSEVLDRLDMAIYSRVDGIVLHAYSDPLIIDKIDRAAEMGIPVITLNDNVHESKRLAYVGNSRYSIGIEVGKTIARLSGSYGKVAVVDRVAEDTNDDMMNLLSLGIHDVFENIDGLTLVTTRNTSQGVLSAENVAVNILKDYPDIDIIYSTDGANTLGIVQVLIDQNKINDIMVIGTSDHDEILDYIRYGGAIDATMVTDYYTVGYGVVETFVKYKDEGIVSTQISPSITVVDTHNIETYLEHREVDDETN